MVKKKRAKKRLTPLEKIRKELVEKIEEIIDEAEEEDSEYQFDHDKWEGTDPD